MFFQCLFKDRNISESKSIRVQALCDDSILFAVTNGLVKPKIHLELANYLQSHTGSKEVLSELNRLGKYLVYMYVDAKKSLTTAMADITNLKVCWYIKSLT